MKEGIHPKYDTCAVSCTCGSTFETRSNRGEIKTEICSDCHPFYTGKEKVMDTEGRVERFRRKYGMQKPAAAE
jgi:large subunit ribosomal protein L31